MTETLLTKCPHCSTTFRLTQAQLDIAGGAVRCGACYQVFHASEHIVKTAVVEEIRTQPAPRPDPVQEAFVMEDDTGLDPYDSADLNLDAGEDEDLFSEDYRASLDTETGTDEFGYPQAGTAGKKKKGGDESWAEDLLKELGEDAADDDLIHDDAPAGKKKLGTISSADSAFSLEDDDIAPKPDKPKKKRTGDDLSDTFKTLGLFGSDDPFAISELEEKELGAGATSDDESWAKAMLDELEEDEKPVKKDSGLSILMDEPGKPEDQNPFAARELARSRREAVERAKAERQRQPKVKSREKSDAKNLRNDDTEDFFRMLDNPDAVNTLADEPVAPAAKLEIADELEQKAQEEEITPMKLFQDSNDVINRQVRLSTLQFGEDEPPRQPLRGALMLLGSLLLLIALAAQYVYFNLDEVSRNPTLRPWLEMVCKPAGCTLPAQSDLSRIVSANLVVRSHPHERNALVIDVIIKNTAPFEQPFPVVQLTFEDINNNPLASRRFLPTEYIHDTSVDIQRMPANTPVHLALEIVDPGKNAVNYQLAFLPVDGKK